MRKKITVLLIISLVLINFMSTAAFASENIQTLNEEHNLEDVKELPQGISPIVINSEEELEQFIQQVDTQVEELSKHKVIYANEDDLLQQSTDGVSVLASNSYDKTVSDYKGIGLTLRNPNTGKNVWAITKFNVAARIEVQGFSGSTHIKKCYWTNTSLTGWTLGINLTNQRSYATIASNTKSIYVHGSGTLDYYLLVKGLVKLYSTNVSHSFTYKLP